MTELEIYKKCLSLGMTQAGAAGCTANILTESAGRPNNVEDRCPMSDEAYTKAVDDGSYKDFIEDRYGYGLCQWTLPSRKKALLEYAKGHGTSIGDEEMQFQFMAREMRESYSYVWNVLTHTSDAYDAGYVMCMQFERPANTQAAAEYRGRKATEIYDRCREVSKTYYDPQKVINFALGEVGYHEKATNSQLDDPTANPGDQNWTKYAAHLDSLAGFYNGRKNGFMWCDVFVDDCFVICYGREAAQYLLCQPNNSAGAGCAYSAQYFKAKNQFYTKDPHPGDQIFFGSGWDDVRHTGLVVSVDANRVYTVEGNTSDCVAKRSYALNDHNIFGYGRPNWGVQDEVSHAPKTVYYDVKLPLLKEGDKNGYVKMVQALLIERGYNCGNKKLLGREKPDGEFGPGTKKSVQDFQRSNGLEPDGEVGGATYAKLLNL